ncbi:hypothetical protein BT93_B0585 [Corymbia citriodora subsp. variegata]|nr:hypothetical protein BT93_B0585 [Corymbia citriodora subsp. variegata]
MLSSLKAEEQKSQPQIVEREDDDDGKYQFETIDKLKKFCPHTFYIHQKNIELNAMVSFISQGINAGDVKKLQDAGICTCNGLLMGTEEDLTGIKGLSEARVDKILEAAEKIVKFGFITGIDALLRRESMVVRITTGSQALNELLGGNRLSFCRLWYRNSGNTEAFGESGSGKTQLAHTLCVDYSDVGDLGIGTWILDDSGSMAFSFSVICSRYIGTGSKPSRKKARRVCTRPTHLGGGNGKLAYIDTEGTFHPDRIIIYAHAYGYVYNMLPDLASKMYIEPFRLLILDPVIPLFQMGVIGRG